MSPDEVIDKLKGPHHIIVIDCLNCGRELAYRSRCRRCGSSSWLPAGYVNRSAVRKALQSQQLQRYAVHQS